MESNCGLKKAGLGGMTVMLLVAAVGQTTYPSKEYVRLGGRVIAIENTPTVQILPPTQVQLPNGTSEQMAALVNGLPSSAVTWTSSPSSLGSISALGLFTAASSGTGSVTIQASYLGGSATTTLTVAATAVTITPATVFSVPVSPTALQQPVITVTLAPAASFNVTANVGWISVTACTSNCSSGSVLTLNVSANTGGARTGTVTISGPTITTPETVTINQLAAGQGTPTLTVAPTALSAPAAVGGQAFSVTTSTQTVSWNAAVSSGSAWLTISTNSSGTGNGVVQLTLLANNTVQPRSGSVIVTYPGGSVTVPVTQAAGVLVIWSSTNPSNPNQVGIPSTTTYKASINSPSGPLVSVNWGLAPAGNGYYLDATSGTSTDLIVQGVPSGQPEITITASVGSASQQIGVLITSGNYALLTTTPSTPASLAGQEVVFTLLFNFQYSGTEWDEFPLSAPGHLRFTPSQSPSATPACDVVFAYPATGMNVALSDGITTSAFVPMGQGAVAPLTNPQCSVSVAASSSSVSNRSTWVNLYVSFSQSFVGTKFGYVQLNTAQGSTSPYYVPWTELETWQVKSFTPAQSTVTYDFNQGGNQDVGVYYPQLNNPYGLNYEYSLLSAGNGGYNSFTNSIPVGSATFDTVLQGDFNGDFQSDVLFYSSATGALQVWLGDGTGNVSLPGVGATTIQSGYTMISRGDFNHDGKTDLLLYRPSDGSTYVALSNGDGSFTYIAQNFSPGFTSVVVGDFSGDGFSDVIAYNSQTTNGYLLLGDGTGHFPHSYGLSLGGGYNVYTGDFNVDGKMDILIYNPSSGAAYVGISNGTGFTFKGLIFSAGFTAVKIGDVNGDGFPDLVLYNNVNANGYLLIGDGSGNFPTGSSLFFGPGYDFVDLRDFNGDGKQDVIIYRSSDGTSYTGISSYSGTNQGSFAYTYNLFGPGRIVAK